MKTRLFISLILLGLLSAQSRSEYGIKTILNVSSYNYSGNAQLDFSIKSGFSIGVWYTFQLSEKWYIQPELIYSLRGGKAEGPARDDMGLFFDAIFTDKLTFLEIPVSFLLKSSEKVYFGAGPYIAFLLDNERELISNYPANKTIEKKTLEPDFIEKSEIGLMFSLIFRIGEFDLSTRYSFGLTNLTKFFDNESFNLGSNNLQIALGFKF